MRLSPTRLRALRQVVALLRRGVASEGDADELCARLLPALSITGIVLVDDWSYTGWGRVEGIEPSWGREYEKLRDQDRSRAALMAAPPGEVWRLRRDAPREDLHSDLYRVFLGHGMRDSAVFRLPNSVLGNIAGGFYRHAGLPLFSDDDVLLISLLHPHLLAGLSTRRAIAAIDAKNGRAESRSLVRGTVHVSFPSASIEWNHGARAVFTERLGRIGARGWRRIERALLAAIRRLDESGSMAASQRLHGSLGLELANVPPGKHESRRVLLALVDEAPVEGDTTPASSAEELLSPRQRQIARLAAGGLTAPEIALRLGIRETTARHHLRVIYERLGVRRRSELATLLKRD